VRAYLDHAATTPMVPDAVEAWLEVAGAADGNPTGMHAEARRARRRLDDARDVLAAHLGARPGEVVLTSGGTESDNLAVFGVLGARSGQPGPVVCTAFEHHAVLRACRRASELHGVELREVPATTEGTIDLDALAAALTRDVSLVSVMLVNNEVGTVQPLAEVAELVRRRAPSARLHTDAVQAVPWLDVATAAAPADLVSVSAHKFGGPVGAGALVVRGDLALAPILHGGGQERRRRSGTPAVAAAWSTAVALEAAATSRRVVPAVARRRDRLVDGVLATVQGVTETVPRSATVAGFAHLVVKGVESEALLVVLDELGVAASAGSSCASGAAEPSHVLLAMGRPASDAGSALRLTLSPTTTDAEVDLALAAVPEAVRRLRD
jgi:cysteine desulfurase